MSEEKNSPPEVVAFIGPNGSGKSTITELLKPIGVDYINADEIKLALKCTDLEAAQIATRQREEYLRERKGFCFETVMSTDRNLKLLQRARSNGFFVRTHIIITATPRLNLWRVRGRVEAGGHDVPADKVISRYKRSLALIKDIVNVSHICDIYDNSSEHPSRIFLKKDNQCFYKESFFFDLPSIKKLTGASIINV